MLVVVGFCGTLLVDPKGLGALHPFGITYASYFRHS